MSIYKYLNYREIIKIKLLEGRTSAFEASSQIGIHSSYFSRVMKGDADFSAEQLYVLAKLFSMSDDELEYFLLLGEQSRSGLNAHQLFVKEKISAIRKQKLKLKENLQGTEAVRTEQLNYASYYYESMTAKLHMLLCLPEYRDNFPKICDRLGITKSKLDDELKKLSALALISWQNGKVNLLKDSIHLDEDDPISAVNHANWRLEAIQKLSRHQSKPNDYHCTVNFTSNEETKVALRDAFKEFLIQAEKIVMKSSSEKQIYTLCFDIFEP